MSATTEYVGDKFEGPTASVSPTFQTRPKIAIKIVKNIRNFETELRFGFKWKAEKLHFLK